MNPRRLRDVRAWFAFGPCLLAALVVWVGFSPTVARAAWSSGGSGHASALAYVMPSGTPPAGAANGGAVTIRWAAATFTNGVPVEGYVINRYNSITGQQASVGAACSGVITTTTCTEQGVPSGTWVYTDTPVQFSWSGAQSPGVTVTVLT